MMEMAKKRDGNLPVNKESEKRASPRAPGRDLEGWHPDMSPSVS